MPAAGIIAPIARSSKTWATALIPALFRTVMEPGPNRVTVQESMRTGPEPSRKLVVIRRPETKRLGLRLIYVKDCFGRMQMLAQSTRTRRRMSEAFPDRRSTCSIPGALVFLRAVIFIAVASLSATVSPAMAQFSPMPQDCMEVMSQAEVVAADLSDVAATEDCGPQSSHQAICPLAGCPPAELTRSSSGAAALGLPEAVTFVIPDTLGAGGSVAPGRRPPIGLRS